MKNLVQILFVIGLLFIYSFSHTPSELVSFEGSEADISVGLSGYYENFNGVVLKSDYSVLTELELGSNKSFDGEGHTIEANKTNELIRFIKSVNGSNVAIRNAVFKGNRDDFYTGVAADHSGNISTAFMTFTSTNDILIENCTFDGFLETPIVFTDCSNVIVKNCIFRNIGLPKMGSYNYDALYVQVNPGAVVTNITIENCVFEGIGNYGVDSPTFQDADAVQISGLGRICNLTITGNQFNEVATRCLKLQTRCEGLTFSGNVGRLCGTMVTLTEAYAGVGEWKNVSISNNVFSNTGIHNVSPVFDASGGFVNVHTGAGWAANTMTISNNLVDSVFTFVDFSGSSKGVKIKVSNNQVDDILNFAIKGTSFIDCTISNNDFSYDNYLASIQPIYFDSGPNNNIVIRNNIFRSLSTYDRAIRCLDCDNSLIRNNLFYVPNVGANTNDVIIDAGSNNVTTNNYHNNVAF